MDKKELVKEAAVKVMSRKGFYNTRTQEIADEAGVAVGTIYNYFQNKNDILDYIFKSELEKRLNKLKKIQEQDLSFWERLENFFQFHFNEVKENISVGEILVREKDFHLKDGSDSINEYLTKIPFLLNNMIEEGLKKGEIKADYESEIVANIIFGAIQGIVEKSIYSEDKEMLEEASKELIKLLREGLI